LSGSDTLKICPPQNRPGEIAASNVATAEIRPR